MALMQGLIKKLGGEDEYGYHQPQGMTNGKVGQLPLQGPGVPIGGGDRGYEMPGTGRSGGVEDAARMLADATAQNDRLKALGNRRAQLDIFDRAGHTALDQEESQIFGMPRSSYVDTPNGAGFVADKAPTGATVASSAPDYKKLGSFADRMGPWNASNEKFQRPWDQMSERYKMLTVLSNFDPRQGITQDVVNALNAADIGGAKFSGSGDKLNATNLQNWRNFDGREGIGDIVQGFKTGNGTWQGWSPEGGEPAAAQGGGGRPSFAGSTIAPLLQGDAQANIQAALGQFGQAQDDSLLQRLIAQLQQGGAQ